MSRETETESNEEKRTKRRAPGGVLTTSLYRGACQQVVVDPQILSHSLWEPPIMSLNILEELF